MADNKKSGVFRTLKNIDNAIAAFSHRLNIRGEKFLQSRLFIGGVSLLISALLWAFVAWDGNTDGTRTFSVQIQYGDLQRGYSMYDKSDGKVSVRLSGRISALSKVEEGDITATVDLRGLQVGQYSLPIKLEVPPFARVRSWEPSTAEIEIYRHIERTLPITWRLDGKAPDGMMLSSVDLQPKEVVLSGPETIVMEVQGVEAVIPSDKLNEQGGIKLPLTIVVADEKNKHADRLKLSPLSVTATLSLTQETIGERIPVKVSVVGQPAEGLEVDSIKVMPDHVNVRGRSEVIRKMQSLVLSPVDITGLDQDLQLMLPLQPTEAVPDIEISGPDRARVDITLRKKMAVKTFSNTGIMIDGTGGSNHEWKLTPHSVTLTIEGPQTAVEELRGTPPCELYIDVSNIVLKQIQLPVLVRGLKRDFQVVRIEPEQVVLTAVE